MSTDRCSLTAVHHRILYLQSQPPLLRIGDFRRAKGIVFDMAVILQLLQDGVRSAGDYSMSTDRCSTAKPFFEVFPTFKG